MKARIKTYFDLHQINHVLQFLITLQFVLSWKLYEKPKHRDEIIHKTLQGRRLNNYYCKIKRQHTKRAASAHFNMQRTNLIYYNL